MRRWMGRLAAAVAALLVAAPASASWLQARSKHFVIYADWSERDLRSFTHQLEQLDATLRWMFKPREVAGAESNPVSIYVLPTQTDVAQLAGDTQSGVLGFYHPRATGSVVFTPRIIDAGAGILTSNSNERLFTPQLVLFHEYAHHFMLGQFAVAYPAWYSEGFAEFVSTAAFTDAGTLMGLPANQRGDALNDERISVEQLFRNDRGRGQSINLIYAKGWLVTHYLMFNKGRAEQWQAYLAKLNAGTPSEQAAREAFGDLRQLDREVDAYLTSRLPAMTVPASALHIADVAVRPLSAGEVAMMRVRTRSAAGVTGETALGVYERGKAIAAAFPADAAVQVWLAEMAYDAEDDDAAEAAADRALAADHTAVKALIYKARVHLRRAERAKATDPAVWTEARSWITRANRLDNNNAEALELFYESFRQQGVAPSANAATALAVAFRLVPQDPHLRWLLARQELVDGDAKAARGLLAALAFDPHGGGPDNPAAKLVALLDAGKTGPEAIAACDAALADKGKKKA